MEQRQGCSLGKTPLSLSSNFCKRAYGTSTNRKQLIKKKSTAEVIKGNGITGSWN